MARKIVLISDDTNFFEYMRLKLELRKFDELFMFSFDAICDKIHLLETAVLIVNSENAREKTIDLLNIFKENPVIVVAYNDDESFKRKCYRAGMFDFMPLLIPDAEFRARMIPALSVAGLIEQKQKYREILVKKDIIANNNDVYLDYNYILDKELEKINCSTKKAVLAAISPGEKTKFLLKQAVVESILLNNIRKNDILMNYAPNKYFLLLYDIDLEGAKKLWLKIEEQFSEKIYAGFVLITNQKRQQIINEVLNKLHFEINNKNAEETVVNKATSELKLGNSSAYSNFKIFKKEFSKRIEKVVIPVFYQIQQKYSSKFFNVVLEQESGEGYNSFHIKGKNTAASFKLTYPGFSKIIIDITCQKDLNNIDTKRIALEPCEFEAGLLEDLLEQFINEYKTENDNV